MDSTEIILLVMLIALIALMAVVMYLHIKDSKIKVKDETINSLNRDLYYLQKRFEEIIERNEILENEECAKNNKLKLRYSIILNVSTKNSININLEDLNLEDLNGCEFTFGEGKNFTCRVTDGNVLLEQYGEGQLHLENINTVFKYNLLKKLLTE